MALDVTAIMNGITDPMLRSGLFRKVNRHEPKSSPVTKVAGQAGLVAAVWVQRVRPVLSSGLASTTALVVMQVRLYTSMLSEPADEIDPEMLTATSKLLQIFSGDFELDGNVRNIDLLGANGIPLEAQAGYLTISKEPLRIMDITLPLIVNDVWEQIP
jgi:hypothetical protein